MLEILVPESELFNEDTNEVITTKSQILRLEHSLVSVAKWEAKWQKIYLTDEANKTDEEIRDYIKCMTTTQNVDPNVYLALTNENIKQITEYINSPQTATVFYERKDTASGHFKKEKISSEIIYYWMIANNVPIEFQKWHLNRLLTLLRYISLKNAPAKKMGRQEALAEQRRLNALRRAKMNSKG